MPGPRCFCRASLVLGAASFLVALSACSSKPPEAAPIGTAYAGPADLKLHKDIDSKSATVTTVHHGDKLAIVGQRRRWYRVRTAAGVEGWTSDRELLDTAQMRRLEALAKETAGMPSQGIATTFGNLNVHTEPSRRSPSFVQIREHEKVDVIAHKLAPRAGVEAKRELVPPKPPPVKIAGKPKKEKVPTPPAPSPPEPPADWLELSKEHDPPPEESSAPVPTDDWTLIRTENGQGGWALTSALYLAIPDEVAQYAEGHRITSYFSLGKISDGDTKKDIWLWTTSDRLGEDHDFDGYRVFTWSLRHHRYETAFIQRRQRGFFPVMAKAGEFSVCLERDDGSRVRKHFVMMGNAVRATGDTPCEKAAEPDAQADAEVVKKQAEQPRGLVERVKQKAEHLFGK